MRAYAARHEECARRGPDYLFHLILDAMVDEYAPVVERIADRLDRLEARMFRRPSREVLARLLRLKRQVSFLRKTLILEREVLARLTRGEFDLIDAREIAYYRNVYDHLVRYTELIEAAREMVSDLMQTPPGGGVQPAQRDHEGADHDLDGGPADDADRRHLRDELRGEHVAGLQVAVGVPVRPRR